MTSVLVFMEEFNQKSMLNGPLATKIYDRMILVCVSPHSLRSVQVRISPYIVALWVIVGAGDESCIEMIPASRSPIPSADYPPGKVIP